MAKKNRRTAVGAVPADAVQSTKPFWDRRFFPAAFFLLLSLIYFYEFPLSGDIIYGADVGTDYHEGAGLSFWDKLQTVSQPMWNPKMGGFPQSEEIRPQYFPTYPIYFFTTFQRYIGWRYIITMFCAGLGMYVYLRQINIGRWAAMWGGVAFMSAPTFLAFPMAGQYAKMGVIALFPWMCLFLERGMQRGRLIHWVGLGAMIGFGVYSHPPIMFYALLAIGVYFLFKVYQIFREQADVKLLMQRSGFFTFSVVLGLAFGAEGSFPLFLYTRTESKRATGQEAGGKTEEQQLAYARSWSLHPEEVASLVVPEFGGYDAPLEGRKNYWGRNPAKYNSEYFGILAVLLALMMVPEFRRRPLVAMWAGIFVLALSYMLGEHTPVHWLAFHLLPGANVQRTIGMGAFVFAFAGCVLAGLGLHRVLEADEGERAVLRRRLLIAGGALTGFALLVALFPKAITGGWIAAVYSDITPRQQQVLAAGYNWIAKGGLYVALVAAAGAALIYLRLQQKITVTVLIAGLCLLTLFDTWRVDKVYLTYVDPDRYTDIRAENPRAVQFLKADPELFRIFPIPSFKILDQPGYHLYGVPIITGFHDLTIGRYDRILQEIEPVVQMLSAKYMQGAEVPYGDGELLAAIQPLLNLLNGKYLVVPKPLELQVTDFPLRYESERFRLYENTQVLPWYYLAPEVEVVEDGMQVLERLRSGQVDPQRVVLLEEQPSIMLDGKGDVSRDRAEPLTYDLPAGLIRLRTHSEGARVLVVSENYHTNWSVFVDGQPAQMLRANYVWKGVVVPAGDHEVEFRYFSTTLAWSRAATLLSLLLIVGMGVRTYWRRSLAPAA
jgi:hypothetical protein